MYAGGYVGTYPPAYILTPAYTLVWQNFQGWEDRRNGENSGVYHFNFFFFKLRNKCLGATSE